MRSKTRRYLLELTILGLALVIGVAHKYDPGAGLLILLAGLIGVIIGGIGWSQK